MAVPGSSGAWNNSPWTARPAAGFAGGALGGRYPEVSMGSPIASGASFCDDFLYDAVKPVSGLTFGASQWTWEDIAGGATMAFGTPSATEIGVLGIATTTTPGDGAVVSQANGLVTGVPVGLQLDTKAWFNNTDYIGAFVGLCSVKNDVPGNLTAHQAVGFRVLVLGGGTTTWKGICKTGLAASGLETVVDMGVNANTSPSRMLFKRTATGVAFATFTSDRVFTDLGETTTNIPSGVDLYPVFGIFLGAGGAASRVLYLDWFEWGGGIPR